MVCMDVWGKIHWKEEACMYVCMYVCMYCPNVQTSKARVWVFLGDIASGKKRGLCVSQGSQFEVCMFPRKIHTHECLVMHVSHKHTYSLLSRYVCVPQTYLPRTWRYVRGLRNIQKYVWFAETYLPTIFRYVCFPRRYRPLVAYCISILRNTHTEEVCRPNRDYLQVCIFPATIMPLTLKAV